MSDWFEEALDEDARLILRKNRVLFDGDTRYQRLVLFENRSFGRVLALDGVLQTTERDEFIYHEMLAHPPLLAHGRARRVLIIGGGDGGMLEEVLKHRAVEAVTLVEIDPAVVEHAQRHLRAICGEAFEDPRAELVIGDGVAFVKRHAQVFDVIIVDSPDPIGPGRALFSEDFLGDCRAALRAGGILVTQCGIPFVQSNELVATMASLRKLFADTACYTATVPTYPGGPMAFSWASDDPERRATALETLRARYAESGVATRYYTPEVHLGAFALPRYLLELIA